MLFCNDINLAFLQIPKNGSRALKRTLLSNFGVNYAPFAEDMGWTVAQFKHAYDSGSELGHPDISASNFDHLTLPFWKEHFPITWETFLGAQSLALVRDPRDRFFSAIMQRLGQYSGERTIRADDPIVREEALRICDWLDGRGSFIDKRYIHFTRQIDYIELDGERVVNAVFPLERPDAVSQWLRDQTDHHIPLSPGHSRREPKKWARPLLKPAHFVSKLFPLHLRKLAYPLWRNSGVFDDAAKRYGSVDLGVDAEAFIAEFYAADAGILAGARADLRGNPAQNSSV